MNRDGFVSFKIAIFGAGILVIGMFLGTRMDTNTARETGSLAAKSFGDVFRRGEGELAAEIPLDRGEIRAKTEVGTNRSREKEEGGSKESKNVSFSPVTSSPGVAAGAEGGLEKNENAPGAPDAPVAFCGFNSGKNIPTRSVIVNEVAWMGNSASAADEWIELKNNLESEIDVSGWQVVDANEEIKIVLGRSDTRGVASKKISGNGFYLLERTDDSSVPNVSAEYVYTGALSNAGPEGLKLFDATCALVDEVFANAGAEKNEWPGGENATKKTLERNANNFEWHTSAASGGTPKAENSAPATSLPFSAPNVVSSGASYALLVSKSGEGSGTVRSDIQGIDCGSDCSEMYAKGAEVTLSASPGSGAAFEKWTGACGGIGACTLTLAADLSVTAYFKLISSVPPQSPPPPSSGGNVFISEVMAGADGNSSYEFVELYNLTGASIDLTGWSLKKRSSTGSESSLVVSGRLEGKVIPAGKYFLLGNDGGYTGSVTPDVLWPSSYNIAYSNNAVILYDASGAKVEEVSWIDIPAGQSYERESWMSSQFGIQSIPTPQNSQIP